MKYARKHDLIASNPMDNEERPKSQRYVGAFYSVSELETLFQAVKGDPCEFPVLMAAFYGLRRSEIMGLRWRAIDFESNLITIDHIQEWLGHSSYNTTANIYAHLDTSSKNTSASKMSNVVIIEPGISTSV